MHKRPQRGVQGGRPSSPLNNSVPRATAVSAVRETSPFANFGTADTAVARLTQPWHAFSTGCSWSVKPKPWEWEFSREAAKTSERLNSNPQPTISKENEMRSLFQPVCALIVMSAASVLFLSGCGQSDSAPSASSTAESESAPGHNYAGWWCTEHGVPEEECALCDASLVAAFKEDDDWCQEHSRPDSQCFVCHPELAEKFAARFTAKFGEEPPQRTK